MPAAMSPSFLRLIGLALLLPAMLATTAAQQPGEPDADRVTLRWTDRPGEVATVTQNSRTEMRFDYSGRMRLQTEITGTVTRHTTLEVDRSRASAVYVAVESATRRVRQDEEPWQTIDQGELPPPVVLDTEARVESVDPRAPFPLPLDAVEIGQTWRIPGVLANALFGRDGFDTIEVEFEYLGRSTLEEAPVHRVRRRLERSGDTGEARVVEKQVADAYIAADESMRLLAITAETEITLAQGAVRASGSRSERTRIAYDEAELHSIRPRFDIDTTQTERTETLADIVLVAQDRDDTDRSAALRRRIETAQTIERTPRAEHPDGALAELDVHVAVVRQSVELIAEQQLVESSTTVGPLEGLRLRLGFPAPSGNDDTADAPATRLLNRDDVIAQMEAARDEAEPGTDRPSVRDRLAAVDGWVEGMSRDASLLAPPRYPVPTGFRWLLPAPAVRAFADRIMPRMDVQQGYAAVAFRERRAFAGRPDVAVLAGRLRASGRVDDLVVVLDVPIVTFYDLEQQRPLLIRGEGRIGMVRRTDTAMIEGHGRTVWTSVFVYDRGPNAINPETEGPPHPLAGEWVLEQPDRPDHVSPTRLEFRRGGVLGFTVPNLRSGRPVEYLGTWRAEVPLNETDELPPNQREYQVYVSLGTDTSDTFRVVIEQGREPTDRRITLRKVVDTPNRTLIRPWLEGQTATYRFQPPAEDEDAPGREGGGDETEGEE